ncbi:UDP-N-acetylmuramoyl-L-alanine--D-glutamate ligase [Mariprofundus ferrooxydans]|uniref:UDP-N-acetylmuramoylalanine--D-glutamate ligase n=1 Tax=Mariprofundus ferrooxydans PV-1 TaxID=314345 RepID=Q0EY60_9PROT|nr:UDP-N-acetylmuramoyl-L-alanine--D-glutamate ligase [Mariprofundus ferrooxydans]EAU54166.1 UDP-N-acetylmuramoyl-L-alanyl-D-glutamate synthetase [Mariprofundus ferrooxydans PV-1]KON48018.1 hypothetical protein AL013_04500 [Mariprofundus ferrooxydans]
MSVRLYLEGLTRGKRVLVLGFGREGRSTLKALLRDGQSGCIAVADANPIADGVPDSVNLFVGSTYLDRVADYDVVFAAPGVPLAAISSRFIATQRITSQADVLMCACAEKTIAVTGTKGKSTTSTIIHRMLQAAGKSSVLVGNIGKPAFDELEALEQADVIVCELSSHQLTTVTRSPNVAVLLNLFPEHLDYYSSLDAYYQAKTAVFRYQGPDDYLVLNADSPECREMTTTALAKKLQFSHDDCQLDAWFDESSIHIQTDGGDIEVPHACCELLGAFNMYNVMAAILATSRMAVVNRAVIEQALKGFTGLPDRMEYVSVVQGVTFINDSISTTPDTTCAALSAFEASVGTLILGGQARPVATERYERLAAMIRLYGVQHLIFLPQNGPAMRDILQRYFNNTGFTVCMHEVNDMVAAVETALQYTAENYICLLSPAAPSFGVYKDYTARGEHFRECIKSLA